MKAQLESFLMSARAAYEEAKINHNTGKCSAEQLENVRLSLERLERTAAALPSTTCGAPGK
jgi:hypothetical protein